MKLFRSLALWGLLLAALAPSGASAASFNFFSTDGLGPTGGIIGPANKFPSSVEVEGLSGTLTKVTLTVIDFVSGRPDDVDMLLVGPEGDPQVMLMSDACGETTFPSAQTWTFDDDAPSLLSDSGPCSVKGAASFKPSNFIGNAPEPDQFGAGGSIFPPFESTLATFAGTDPNGFWDLFVRDDQEGVAGFEITGWALTLTVEPPVGPPAPGPPTSTTPPAATTTPSAPSAPGPTKAAKTGKRAAALAKCKLKNTKEKRVKCRVKARKLPV
jgi:hypothetical protein